MGRNWAVWGNTRAAGRDVCRTNGCADGRHCWAKHLLQDVFGYKSMLCRCLGQMVKLEPAPCYCCLALRSAGALLTCATCNHCLEEHLHKSSGTKGGLEMGGLKRMYNWQRSSRCHRNLLPCCCWLATGTSAHGQSLPPHCMWSR